MQLGGQLLFLILPESGENLVWQDTHFDIQKQNAPVSPPGQGRKKAPEPARSG